MNLATDEVGKYGLRRVNGISNAFKADARKTLQWGALKRDFEARKLLYKSITSNVLHTLDNERTHGGLRPQLPPCSSALNALLIPFTQSVASGLSW